MLLYLTLALEIEATQITVDADVFGRGSGRRIPAVFAGVDLTARSEEASGQNAQDASHHSFAPESGFPELAGDCLAHVWQGFHKLQQPIKFLPLGSGDVVRVIEILPSACSVLADGLKRAAGRSIDRHTGPGWRDSQGTDSGPGLASDSCAATGDFTKASAS